ncbi:CAP domain-containing protein [Solibacillus sp. FSL H8-0538]|uniref:CAP domain-containing protein n=1 Tax=Solibacillus sp. FSL H8-0538 TaxID=2921400 RepID=UPI00404696B2
MKALEKKAITKVDKKSTKEPGKTTTIKVEKKTATPAEKTTPQKEVTKEQVVTEQPTTNTEVEKAPVTQTTTEQSKTPEANTNSNASQNTTNSTTNTTEKAASTATDIDAIEAAVVELTNAERAKAGLQPLQAYTPLMAAAREKSQDMKDKNYFSHTSPTYGSPFDRLKALGISYQAAGENIAKGQRTAEEVVTAWMNSEGHRANILNENFTHIGVGYVKEGNIWTQQFIKQ